VEKGRPAPNAHACRSHLGVLVLTELLQQVVERMAREHGYPGGVARVEHKDRNLGVAQDGELGGLLDQSRFALAKRHLAVAFVRNLRARRREGAGCQSLKRRPPQAACAVRTLTISILRRPMVLTLPERSEARVRPVPPPSGQVAQQHACASARSSTD